jgi:hypothetical protein
VAADRVTFGAYEAHDVRRSSTEEREERILWTVRGSVWQTLSFQLREGLQELWQVHCQATAETSVTPVPPGHVTSPGPTRLSCVFTAAADSALRWELSAEARGDAPLSGAVRRDADSYAVVGTNALEGGGHFQSTTSGYYVALNDRTLGAVDLLNAGAVYLAADLTPTQRGLVAGVAATFLLLGSPAAAAERLATQP